MSECVALIDLGSNAVRLLLASVLPDVGFCVLREERLQTRLGDSRSGTLAPSAVKETVKAVREFLYEVQSQRPRAVAVATSAVREASNRAILLDALRQATGIEVEVLRGEEEARLGALAVLRRLPSLHGVIVDLGGGSLQITRVQGGTITAAASFPLGVVRLTRRFFKHDPPTERELLELRKEVRDQVWRALPRARGNEVMIGLGGTVRALARIHTAAVSGHDFPPPTLTLQRSTIAAFRKQFEAIPVRARCVPGLRADRADIIVAGMVVIEELMILGGYRAITICFQGGVRQGVLIRETFRRRSLVPG